MAEHATLTDPDLHDLKGVASATDGMVPVADTGATVWQLLTTDSVEPTSFWTVNDYYLTTFFSDISTASTILVPIIQSSTLVTATLILTNTITGADSTVTFTNSNGASPMGNIVIAESGSVEGTTFTFTPSTNEDVDSGRYIKIVTDGVSSTACRVDIVLRLTKIGG